jgi:hypothetical protein
METTSKTDAPPKMCHLTSSQTARSQQIVSHMWLKFVLENMTLKQIVGWSHIREYFARHLNCGLHRHMIYIMPQLKPTWTLNVAVQKPSNAAGLLDKES